MSETIIAHEWQTSPLLARAGISAIAAAARATCLISYDSEIELYRRCLLIVAIINQLTWRSWLHYVPGLYKQYWMWSRHHHRQKQQQQLGQQLGTILQKPDKEVRVYVGNRAVQSTSWFLYHSKYSINEKPLWMNSCRHYRSSTTNWMSSSSSSSSSSMLPSSFSWLVGRDLQMSSERACFYKKRICIWSTCLNRLSRNSASRLGFRAALIIISGSHFLISCRGNLSGANNKRAKDYNLGQRLTIIRLSMINEFYAMTHVVVLSLCRRQLVWMND